MAPLLDNGIVDAWLTVPEAVQVGGISRRTIYRHLEQRPTKSQRDRGGQVEYRLDDMPHVVQQTYVQLRSRHAAELDRKLKSELSSEAVSARLSRFDEETRDAFLAEAARRYRVLLAWDACGQKLVGRDLTPEAQAILDDWRCTDPRVLVVRPTWSEAGSVSSFYRLAGAVKSYGALALIPEAPKAARADDRRLRPLAAEVTNAIKHMRLIAFPNATTQSLHRKLVALFGDGAPSLTRLKRFLRAEISHGVDTFARHGGRAFEATAAPYVSRDYSTLDVCEWICGDQHQLDVQVIDPDRQGELDRPWVTMFTDLRTRAPVGWWIGFEHNTETIIEAFIHAVRPKRDPAFEFLCGLPTAVYIDNGKDYRSARFDALLAQHQIQVAHALPFNAKAKNVERFFRTVNLRFSRDQETYFGSGPADRPGRYAERLAQHERWRKNQRGATTPFVTLDEIKRRFAAFAVEFITDKHEGLHERETGRERSPADVAADRRTPARIPQLEHLEFIAMRCFERVVDRGQVSVDNIFYRHEALLHHDRRRVRCRRSPSDITELLVYSQRDEFLCRAKAAEIVPMQSGAIHESALRELARIKREKKQIRNEYYALRDAEASGVSDIERAIERQPAPRPEPTTPATPAATLPADAAIAFQPQIARQVNEARAAIADEPEDTNVIEFATPAIAATSTDDEDERAALAMLGARPPTPRFYESQRELQKAMDDQADWDRARLEIIAERQAKRAAKRIAHAT